MASGMRASGTHSRLFPYALRRWEQVRGERDDQRVVQHSPQRRTPQLRVHCQPSFPHCLRGLENAKHSTREFDRAGARAN